MQTALVLLGGFALTGSPFAGEDLGERYPATLEWSQDATGLEWTCAPEDVWELKSFEFEKGKKLGIEFKSADVAFGRTGTDVLWAAVVPDKPAKLSSSLAGDGESVTSLFLRFHGSRVGSLFPDRTVRGNGPKRLVAAAQRLCNHKMGWRWTAGARPVVMPRSAIILDFETEEGTRRCFFVDWDGGTVEYEPSFEDQPLPPSPPLTKKEALEAFDEVWEAFDREYAGFVLLPELDWDALGKRYRKEAASAKTTYELGALLAEMLAALEDLHVWVKVGEEFVPGYSRPRPLNASWRGVEHVLGGLREEGPSLRWGRTDDGIGYVNVSALSDKELPAQLDRALEELADTWAMVVDLRFNGGGDELLAASLAGRFLDERRVYSLNQYRAGPKRDQLGSKLERAFEPRGPWRYEAPVVVLQGQKVMSSAESMVLMLAQCPQVTTMGDRTAGSSANPRRLELECGITVNQPRWLDMDPEGNPIEHVGIAPDVELRPGREGFSHTEDALFTAALERLRDQPEAERTPGRSP